MFKAQRKRSRPALFVAALAFAIGLAFTFGPTINGAEAKEAGLESDVQAQVVAGSELTVIIDGPIPADPVNWAVGVEHIAFDGTTGLGGPVEFVGNSATMKDLPEGWFKFTPADPIANGWKAVGSRLSVDGITCPQTGTLYSAATTLGISDVNPKYTLCIYVEPAAELTVEFVAPGTTQHPWTGTVHGPNGFSASLQDLGIGGAKGKGTVGGLFSGEYSVELGALPEGWEVFGWTEGHSNMFPVDPFVCPLDKSEYVDPNQFGAPATQITAIATAWTICIYVQPVAPGGQSPIAPDSKILVELAGPGAGPGVWKGTLIGPGSIEPLFGYGKSEGSKLWLNMPYGEYRLDPGHPIRNGFAVRGVTAFTGKDPLAVDCGSELKEYHPADFVELAITKQVQTWKVCFWVEPEPAQPEPEQPTHPFFPWTHEPIDWPAQPTPEPGPTSTPAPTGTPTATATPEPSETPAGQAVPEQPVEPQTVGGDGESAAKPVAGAETDAPLPPNTGTGGAGAVAGSGWSVHLGVLLMVLSGAIVAANRLPGRLKR